MAAAIRGLASIILNMDLKEYRSEHVSPQVIASFWFGQDRNRSFLVPLIQPRHSLGEVSPLQSAIAYTLSGDSPVEKLKNP